MTIEEPILNYLSIKSNKKIKNASEEIFFRFTRGRKLNWVERKVDQDADRKNLAHHEGID